MIKEEKLKEAFDIFDVDHSGSITIDEVKKVLGGGKGNDIDDTEWERIVDEVDVEGDGEISFHEFKLMIYTLLGIPIPKNDQMLMLLKDEESPVYKQTTAAQASENPHRKKSRHKSQIGINIQGEKKKVKGRRQTVMPGKGGGSKMDFKN